METAGGIRILGLIGIVAYISHPDAVSLLFLIEDVTKQNYRQNLVLQVPHVI